MYKLYSKFNLIDKLEEEKIIYDTVKISKIMCQYQINMRRKSN